MVRLGLIRLLHRLLGPWHRDRSFRMASHGGLVVQVEYLNVVHRKFQGHQGSQKHPILRMKDGAVVESHRM